MSAMAETLGHDDIVAHV